MKTSDRNHARWLVALASLVMLGACSNEPDEEWAQENYSAKESLIDRVEKELEAEFTKLAPVPYAKLPEATRDADLEAQFKRVAAFDEKALEILESDDEIIGWDMTYSFPEAEDPVIPHGFDKSSSRMPSYQRGTVRTDRRDVTVSEDRKLAWGLYQKPGEEMKEQLGFNVPNYQRGFEVAFDIKQGDAVLKVAVFVIPAVASE